MGRTILTEKDLQSVQPVSPAGHPANRSGRPAVFDDLAVPPGSHGFGIGPDEEEKAPPLFDGGHTGSFATVGGETADAGVAKPDNYAERLIKYIPSEVIAVYLTLEGIVKASEYKESASFYWSIFLFGLTATWLYLYKVVGVRKTSQLAVSTLAFAVWVFSFGGPFRFLGIPDLVPALVLPAFTFAVPFFEP